VEEILLYFLHHVNKNYEKIKFFLSRRINEINLIYQKTKHRMYYFCIIDAVIRAIAAFPDNQKNE
jgi:hypothetical protein